METQGNSVIENVSRQFSRSATLKLFSVLILMLVLLIPVAFIESMIYEREELRKNAVAEVSEKWSKEQTINGPVISIPYLKKGSGGSQEKETAYLLPEKLSVTGEIFPSSLKRGIYEVVVYDSKLRFEGSFNNINKYLSGLNADAVLWNEATAFINITDMRGIKEKLVIKWNGSEFKAEPGINANEDIGSGVTVKNVFTGKPESEEVQFSFNLILKGSNKLNFIPVGSETKVDIKSSWETPSFSGSFLPESREVGSGGFTAGYKILELNRNYPEFWSNDQYTAELHKSSFGVDLLLPVDDYQKSIRSTKYALLTIALTFLTFFLVEIFNSRKIHAFQYVLVGLALCLFYSLLVAISEHLSFNLSYLAAAVSVITMIGLYGKAILKNIRQTVVLVMVLIFVYSFVFVTLQLQDYALLIGSFGLAIILGGTMFITRKINWYDLGSVKKPNAE